MGVARNVIKDAKLVPGGGASEMAVAATLKKKSTSIEGVEQVFCFTLCFSKLHIGNYLQVLNKYRILSGSSL